MLFVLGGVQALADFGARSWLLCLIQCRMGCTVASWVVAVAAFEWGIEPGVFFYELIILYTCYLVELIYTCTINMVQKYMTEVGLYRVVFLTGSSKYKKNKVSEQNWSCYKNHPV